MAGIDRWYSRLVRGEITGVSAALLRLILDIAARCYQCIINIRNRLYDGGWLKVYKLPVPVICIGNITAGGTGKTPMVIWLCRYLMQNDLTPAILSRGYKATDGNDSDEVNLLKNALPEVPVISNSNRVQGGKLAISKYNADVLVMDDGFQHRRLVRDLDIVMIDSLEPFGLGKMLPRGFLREPVSALSRANVIIISRSEMLPKIRQEQLESTIQGIVCRVRQGLLPVVYACTKITRLLSADDAELPLGKLQNGKVMALCGIGNPQSFITTLQRLGAVVVAESIRDDHFVYNSQVCREIAHIARQNNAEMVVTTEKDWVKLKKIDEARDIHNLCRLQIATDIMQGKELLCKLIDETIQADTSDKQVF